MIYATINKDAMITEAKTTEKAYYDANGNRISKTMAWALSHVGFVDEVTDPELRSQMVNFRDEYKEDEEMKTQVKTTEEAYYDANGKRISKAWAWAMAHKGIICEVTDPELRSQMANFRNKSKSEVTQ